MGLVLVLSCMLLHGVRPVKHDLVMMPEICAMADVCSRGCVQSGAISCRRASTGSMGKQLKCSLLFMDAWSCWVLSGFLRQSDCCVRASRWLLARDTWSSCRYHNEVTQTLCTDPKGCAPHADPVLRGTQTFHMSLAMVACCTRDASALVAKQQEERQLCNTLCICNDWSHENVSLRPGRLWKEMRI